jgi:hypothetical protein
VCVRGNTWAKRQGLAVGGWGKKKKKKKKSCQTSSGSRFPPTFFCKFKKKKKKKKKKKRECGELQDQKSTSPRMLNVWRVPGRVWGKPTYSFFDFFRLFAK